MVATKGLSQLGANGVRVDSTLGNAAYMAIYMLFHIFFLLYLFVRSDQVLPRIIYVLTAMMFIFVLLQTGTRGTAIGLAVGAVTTVAYIALFATQSPQIRRYAIGSFVVLLLLAGGFFMARDSAYIQSNSTLARIANIDLGHDLAIRSIIWGMALEGVEQRPLLGWGQSNFNYVFNAEYDPRLYAQEQWFDRVHNIVLDWLIAGGIIGFLAYFSIFAALAYYLFVRPFYHDDRSFTVMERGVLVGLIAGYLTHNLVVFDNIVSYIFFGTILALIHSRVGRDLSAVTNFKMDPAVTLQVAAPIAAAACALCVYFVNVPSMQAAGDIINALRSNDLSVRLDYFDEALTSGSFAKQEIVEQFVQQALSVARQDEVDAELRQAYLDRAANEIETMIKDKPGDARLHVFAASFYRSVNDLERAESHLLSARDASPQKPSIIIQQGAVAVNQDDPAAALAFFKEAFLLEEENHEARAFYAAELLKTGDTEEAVRIINEGGQDFITEAAANDYLLSAANASQQFELMADIYEARVAADSADAQAWASLAFIYYKLEDKTAAIDALDRASQAVPTFSAMAACIADNIKNDREPQLGCQ